MPFIEIDNHNYKINIKHHLVACFCADWCTVCRQYKENFFQVTKRFPDTTFLWIDIEKNTQLTDLYEIDSFPTVLIEDEEGVRYFSVIKASCEALSYILKHSLSFSTLSIPSLQKNLA